MYMEEPRMMKRKKNKNLRYERWVKGAIVLGGVVVLVLSMLGSYGQQKKEIEQSISEDMGRVKTTCQKYDNYEIALRTEDLQNLIDKSDILNAYVDDYEEYLDVVLPQFAEDQYLSGIVILDKELNVIENVDVDGNENQVLLNGIYEKVQMESMLKIPQKVYANSMLMEGRNYQFVVTARTNGNGILIAYQDKTSEHNDKYELSLSSLLDDVLYGSEDVLVVADGEQVLYSNRTRLSGLAVKQCPLSDVISYNMLPENDKLIKIEFEGNRWYGKCDIYRGYYLYIFVMEKTIYPDILREIGITFGVYLIFALITLLFLQRQKKEELYRTEREYYMLTAIARIYDANVLLHLEENTWEVILQTDAMKREITGIKRTDEMLRVFCDRLMMESARAQFLEFVDLSTMAQRLEGKSFLGYIFEAVNGVWYQALLVPKMRDEDNHVTTVMLLLRNVTDQTRKELDYREKLRIAMEKADATSNAKTEFLRSMSHDMRTPINGILGMANMGLHSLKDTEFTKSCFEKICLASGFLLELVNNVLDMSRIEKGEEEAEQFELSCMRRKDSVDLLAFDLIEIFQEVESIMSYQASEAGIHLEYNKPEGEHLHLIGNPMNIQRIIQNIISNAIKYNKPGGRVFISCKENGFDGEIATFVFRCEDTGIGMSTEFQNHVYEMYAQEHKGSITTYSGSGIGLFVVKKIVESMDGKIHFVSEEGIGTTFTVELPLRVNFADEKNAETESLLSKNCSIKGVRVLLAEDNELNREIATYMLESLEVDVTEARNGKEALEIFMTSENDFFDIILMDIRMPEMDGLEATRKIRELNREDGKTIPIIAISANAFSEDVEECKLSGMNEHLSKPLDFDKVYDVIRHYTK